MSVRPNSQCGRILAVLNDGQSHSTAELYRRLGGMVLHSRIAELRKQGYNVTCERLPGVKGAAGYIYRLTNPDREKASQRVTTVVDPYGREATTRRFNALRDEHRGGRPWPEERFECNPDESAGLADPVDAALVLPWEEVSGKTDPRERFGIYSVGDDGEPHLEATTGTEEGVGVTICTLGREGHFYRRCVGVLDRMGEKGQRWLALPWAPMDNL